MADRILLEDGSGILLLEDGTGGFIIESAVTVTPNTADAATLTALPTLEFTGAQTDDDDVRYQLQISPSTLFNFAGVVDSYASSNADSVITVSSATPVEVGQSFTCSLDTVLSQVIFNIYKIGTPTGNVVAKIYAHSGVYGTSSIPIGSALATSNTLDVSLLPTTATNTTFTFSGGNLINLTSGTNYVVTLNFAGGSLSNAVNVSRDTSSPTHSGNYVSSSNGTAFTAANTTDICFQVIGSGVDGVVNAVSGTDAGFSNTVTPGDTDPFNDAQKIAYTSQASSTQILTINGEGTHAPVGWADEAGDFTRVQSDDGDTTRLYTPTTGSTRSLTHTAATTGGTVVSLTINAKIRNLNAVDSFTKLGVRIGGTNYFSADITKNGTTYETISHTFALNPATGTAWTLSSINSAELLIQKNDSVGTALTFMNASVSYSGTFATGTYYWRVRGIDPSGANAYGAWSTTRSFSVVNGTQTSQPQTGKANILPAPYVFSRESRATLPANNADLAIAYTSGEITTVISDPNNTTDVALDSTNLYAIHHFEWYVAPGGQVQPITAVWKGVSVTNASTSNIVLQIYNVSTTTWVTLATDTTTVAGAQSILTGTQSTSLANFYDVNGYAYFRVYQ